MQRRFGVIIVWFVAFCIVCEAALFEFSPSVRSAFEFLGTPQGRIVFSFILIAACIGCLIGIAASRLDSRLQNEQDR